MLKAQPVILITIEGYIQQSDLMCASKLLLSFWIMKLVNMALNTIAINLINEVDLQW